MPRKNHVDDRKVLISSRIKPILYQKIMEIRRERINKGMPPSKTTISTIVEELIQKGLGESNA